MQITFSKYQGTGNDFILIDNRNQDMVLSEAQVARLCNRRFGIGADGLMLIAPSDDADFRMVYYNADGRESSMCGNGGRCIVAFAKKLGMVQDAASFMAVDGLHTALIHADGSIDLSMKDVRDIHFESDHSILNTGSPHHVQWVEDADAIDVFKLGKSIRMAAGKEGINVNFTQQRGDGIYVRTYERGVEEETLSCGTGVTAAAIASVGTNLGTFKIAIATPGGNLEVSFTKKTEYSAEQVVLSGPATMVYEGLINEDFPL